MGLLDATCSPTMSPYRVGLPIDSIQRVAMSKAEREPLLELYGSWICMLIWLSVSTWSDLTPVISLLSPYQSGLSPGHLDAAKYAGKLQNIMD